MSVFANCFRIIKVYSRLMMRVVSPAAASAPRAAPSRRDTERLRVQLALRPPVRALAATLRPEDTYILIRKSKFTKIQEYFNNPYLA